MSYRILTLNVASIDVFMCDPLGSLANAEDDTVAIFANNVPVFYAITSTRLEQFLDLEARLAFQANSGIFEKQVFEELAVKSIVPIGKFAMYSGWKPDVDFQRQAALWGIAISQPVTSKKLTSFISWRRGEGKVFTHIQWKQKLSRSLQIVRSSSRVYPKRDINAFSQPDMQIPHGFRGTK